MDVSLDQLVLILAAIGGLGAVMQHFGDRYLHNGLYKRTLRVAEGAPQKIASAVETALNASLDRQRALAEQDMQAAMKAQEQDMQAAMKAQEAEMAKAGQSLKMSGTRQIGLEKGQMRELQGLMVDGVMGPAMQAIEAWNPDWADKLRQVPPQLLMQFMESPWFQSNILPRIKPFMDRFLSQAPPGIAPDQTPGGGWQ